MKHLYRLILFFFYTTCLIINGKGQDLTKEKEINLDQIFNASLDELLNMTIDVASKNTEKTSDAPASVSSFTQDDIERFGYYTIRDLANVTPGYSSFRGIGEITLETRGQKADGFDNNKHLVLIDGIPFSNSRANKALTEEDLPLFWAKQVEFMKGPASALYGISAYYGVINIKNNIPESFGTTFKTRISGGNLDFKRRLQTSISHKSNDGISFANIGFFAKDATKDYLGNGKLLNSNSLNYDNTNSIFTNIGHRFTTKNLNGLRLGVIYSRKTGGLGDFWMNQQNQTYEFNELTWEELVPYVGFEKKFNHGYSINTYLKENISSEKATTGGYQKTFNNGTDPNASIYHVRIYETEYLLEGKREFARGSVIAGINYNTRNSPGAPVNYAYYINTNPGNSFSSSQSFYSQSSIYNTYSAYFQFQYNIPILKGLNTTLGLRNDNGKTVSIDQQQVTNHYSKFSPRMALVQKITNEITIKTTYGQALRAPMLKEISLNEEVKYEYPEASNQIPNLTPETIKSFDASFIYSKKTIYTDLTFFTNKTQNTLGKTNLNGIYTGQINSNLREQIIGNGFEFDVKLLPSRNIRLGTNYALATTKKSKHGGSFANVPVSTYSANLTYYHFSKVNFNSTLIAYGISQYQKGGEYNNERLAGNFLLDWNTIVTLSDHINIELQFRNLLNRSYRTPAFFPSGELNVPGAKRSFLLSLVIKF